MGSMRRRLRQRADESVGASDGSSDAELEFIGVKSGYAARGLGGGAAASAAGGSRGARDPWACPLCTFLNEDARATRCEMCDSAREDAPPRKKTRKMSQWLERSSQPSKQKTKARAESSDDGSDDFAAPSRFVAGQSTQLTPKSRGGHGKTGDELWADKYAPASVGDLCINKKKVEGLREWMARNAAPTAADEAVRPYPARQRLLFLCGPPGAGKSTAVRCIARELGLAVIEWADNESAGRLNYDRKLNAEFQTPYVSSLSDFADFVRQSVSYSALPLVAASRRKARSAKVSTASEESSQLHRKRKSPGGDASSTTAPVTAPTPPGHVILLENWPESWSREQKAASEEKLQQVFRQIVDPGARYRGFPVVCIYSEARESKVAADQLSRKFSADVARSPFTAVMNINPVTTAALKKHLTRVVEREKCRISQSDIDSTIATANGDIRHALHTLQAAHNRLRGLSSSQPSRSKPKDKKRKQGTATEKIAMGADDSGEPRVVGRDAFLSDFRVLGKILYGKTLVGKAEASSRSASSSQPLDYEAMISTSGLTIDRALAFVHENGIGYFSAIEDLAEAMEVMSVTENIVAASYDGSGDSEVFKRANDLAQSLLIRSIAVTNKNPERAGFRPITGPRMYATSQRMVSRRDEWLQRSLTDELSVLHHQYVCSGDAYLFEVEPFLAVIEAADPRRLSMRSHQAPEHQAVDLSQLRVEVDDEIESSDGDPW